MSFCIGGCFGVLENLGFRSGFQHGVGLRDMVFAFAPGVYSDRGLEEYFPGVSFRGC